MVWGVTAAGFVKKTFESVYASIKDGVHAIPGMARVNLERDSYLGNIVAVCSAAISDGWDVLQEVYSSFDPDAASGQSLDNLCRLTGTSRRAATHTLVTCTVNVDPGVYAVGSLTASVVGTPTSRFTNLDQVTNASGGAASYVGVRFQCDATGPVRAPSGSLTVIASPVAGWNSVTNPLDGAIGRDTESDAELRVRRESELSANGASTFDAMIDELLSDSRIVQVRVFQNDTDVAVGTLPPHSFEVVVYDGTADGSRVSNEDIAALIWRSKPSGVRSVGATLIWTPGRDGFYHVVRFSRPVVVPIYVSYVVTQNSADGVTDPLAALLASVLAWTARRYNIGDDVVWSTLYAPAIIPGIYDVREMYVGLAPSPSGTSNVTIDDHSIAVFDSSRISISS